MTNYKQGFTLHPYASGLELPLIDFSMPEISISTNYSLKGFTLQRVAPADKNRAWKDFTLHPYASGLKLVLIDFSMPEIS